MVSRNRTSTETPHAQHVRHAPSHTAQTPTHANRPIDKPSPSPYTGHKGEPVLIGEHGPDQEGILDRVPGLVFLEDV